MVKQYLTDVIKEDYKNWNKGDLVFITAGTGCGKTYFVKNELNEYCKLKNKQILYLSNRDNLKAQVQNDIGEDSNITVLNYQKIEHYILNGTLNLSNYTYIIMDEAHYFFTDSAFNIKTDLFFNEMLNNKNIIKVLMTATPKTLTLYFKENDIEYQYFYELESKYDFFDKVVCFNTYESIDVIIQEIPQDEQILFFSNAKKALEISQKYDGRFICSKYNKLWNKYIAPKKKKNKKGKIEEIPTENYLELQNIIQNSTFNSHLLCCTTAIDNGVNIKEFSPVKHIIIDILDRDEFIQCLGRKRIGNNEKINLYFYGWEDNKRINGFRTKVNSVLARADYLIENGEIEYTKHKFKTNIGDSRIIDDIIGIDNQIHKTINKCMYQKYTIDKIMYDTILYKKYNIKFRNIIALAINKKMEDIIIMEIKIEKENLKQYLESITGVRLFKEEQEELKNKFQEYGLNAKTLGINTLNGYIKDKKLAFLIVPKMTSNMIDGKKKNIRYWETIKDLDIN